MSYHKFQVGDIVRCKIFPDYAHELKIFGIDIFGLRYYTKDHYGDLHYIAFWQEELYERKEENKMEELDFALHVLYTAVDKYPCVDCEFANSCMNVKTKSGCIVKKSFDVVHQEILRKEDKAQ